MNIKTMAGAGVLALSVLLVGWAFAADTKVTLSEMHICCGGCVKGIEKAAGSVSGVSFGVNRGGKSTELSGDAAAVQKAVDAIAAAGYHGTSDHEKIKMPEDSGLPKGRKGKLMATELTVSGFHNCCGGCAKAAKAAVESVDGVKGHTIDKGTRFKVTGKFDARALVEALQQAGYHVKISK